MHHPRPTEADRKTDAGNTAVPAPMASYLVMLAAATQGSLGYEQMQWEISLAKGWSLIHGRWIYDGSATLWADRTVTKTGAWLTAWRRQASSAAF